MSSPRERRLGSKMLLARRARRPLVELMESRTLLATIVVTGTGDTIANDGVVTLREAIIAANTNAASGDAPAGTAGLDTIAFNIPGPGVHTITVLSDLPSITEPLVIDGYTQPGASPNTNGPGLGDNAALMIQIVPNQARSGSAGLRITGGGSTARGLAISGFLSGIDLQTIGGNTVAGNFIGTTPDGSARASFALNDAVLLQSSNNTIGGIAPADRNLLSGAGQAIHVPLNPVADASNNVIEGNFLGTDATGTQVIPNLTTILIESGSGDRIGGTTPGAGNLITGSSTSAIVVLLGGPVAGSSLNSNGGHVIQGNLIGTDVTGTTALTFTSNNVTLPGNSQNGIYFLSTNSFPPSPTVNPLPITIGGAAAGASNVISGNGGGISLNFPSEFVAPTLIQNNFIGTDRTRTKNLGNNFGINLSRNLRNVTISDNTIAFNTSGVVIPGGETGTLIVNNSIHDNTGGNPGITRADNTGPAAPTLTSATVSGANTTVIGTVSGAAGSIIRVDLYANATPPQGITVQGQTSVKTLQVTVGSNGAGGFTTSFPNVPSQPLITATATSPSNTTSPFSAPAAPPTGLSADLAVTAAGTPNPVAAGANITYTIALSNNGPNTAQAVSLTTAVPTGTTFVSFTAPVGWTPTTPAAGGTGSITATASSLGTSSISVSSLRTNAVGTSIFTLVVHVAPAAVPGSTISLSVQAATTTSDPIPGNNSATVATTVAGTPPDNTPPTAVNDTYTVTAGATLTVPPNGVLANDTNPLLNPLIAHVTAQPSHGALALNFNGSFTYTPAPGFVGVDSFTYEAIAGQLASTPATVTINVTPSSGEVFGPQITVLLRYGYHAQPTLLILGFDQALSSGPASNLTNYQLVTAGRDGRFGTRDDGVIKLQFATYDPILHTVRLTTRKPLPLRHTYQLTVHGGPGGLTNASGIPLNSVNGSPGSDTVLKFDRTILAGRSIPKGPSAVHFARHSHHKV